MSKIETRRIPGTKTDYLLKIDGVVVTKFAHLFGGFWVARIYDFDHSDLVRTCGLSDFNRFEKISFAFDNDWSDLISGIEIQFKAQRQSDPRIRFEFAFDADNWSNPYSMLEYVNALKEVASAYGSGVRFFADDTEIETQGFGIDCPVRNIEGTIGSEIDSWEGNVSEILRLTAERLQKLLQKDALISLFSFPKAVKASCEQYLLYFVQFLEDLGIKAEAEIKEEAGHVLFSVIPEDGASALGKIKEALEVYLDIPINPEFDTTSGKHSDVAVAQLRANVFFLQSQLSLMQAIVETKNATIQALNFSLYQQNQFLIGPSGKIADSPSQKDSEPIIGDTVHLTKYEGRFLKVDLPTILRRLKRSFGLGSQKKDGENG